MWMLFCFVLCMRLYVMFAGFFVLIMYRDDVIYFRILMPSHKPTQIYNIMCFVLVSIMSSTLPCVGVVPKNDAIALRVTVCE